jgi:hypothetical protein
LVRGGLEVTPLVGDLQEGLLLEAVGLLALPQDLVDPERKGLPLHRQRRKVAQPEGVADLVRALLGDNDLAGSGDSAQAWFSDPVSR